MPPLKSTSDPRKAKIPKYTPAHGRDYEIVMRAADDYRTSRTRDRISYVILFFALCSIATAAGYGIYSGNFNAVKDVWAVAGPIVGAIVGFYFQRGRNESG